MQLTDAEWEDIIARLTAFTTSWVKGKDWFRSDDTGTFLMGKKVEDYVYEAIGRLIASPEKFDPSKGDLLNYLKYNLIRSLVSNDLNLIENTHTLDVYARDHESDGDENALPYSERLLPYTSALFPDDIDYDAIKVYMEKEIQDDTDVENLFLGIYSYDMKRREIIEEFNITGAAYDNAMRRFTTILKRAATHFNTTNKTYE